MQTGAEQSFDRVTNLRPDDSEANPFWYMFKVQCTSCRETHANYVGVNRFVWDIFFISPSTMRWSTGGLHCSDTGDERHEREQGRGQFCVEVQELQGERVEPVAVLGTSRLR